MCFLVSIKQNALSVLMGFFFFKNSGTMRLDTTYALRSIYVYIFEIFYLFNCNR